MTIIKPSRCSVILTQSLGSLGTWLSPLVYPTKIVFRYLLSLSIFYKYLINERRTKAHSAERYEIHSISCCFHKFCFISDSFDDDHNFLINSTSSTGEHRVLRWLPSHQRWCPKLAGLPHQTTLPPLAQRSLDSLESYLPIQHGWHRIHRLPKSLAWRLWHHYRRTYRDGHLSTLRIRQHPEKWVCELHCINRV